MSFEQFFEENPFEALDVLEYTDQDVIDELERSGKYAHLFEPGFQFKLYQKRLKRLVSDLVFQRLLKIKSEEAMTWSKVYHIAEAIILHPELMNALYEHILALDDVAALRIASKLNEFFVDKLLQEILSSEGVIQENRLQSKKHIRAFMGKLLERLQ
ncbi:MAG: hypothetical protein Solivirus2_21 [Solivirus sp.]|uniref:Uncharacterized protein n=1 Tax=Solivirus sp. TaxID=2487772 RepID=A0A3G5AFI4_9VIRU|nr:MAG: hypothetical protein Solivirus2_21 [Solivirus sp.]